MLAALETTADNIRHLHSSQSGAVWKAYEVWLRVVEEAIQKAHAEAAA
jgi:hypothetical protein